MNAFWFKLAKVKKDSKNETLINLEAKQVVLKKMNAKTSCSKSKIHKVATFILKSRGKEGNHRFRRERGTNKMFAELPLYQTDPTAIQQIPQIKKDLKAC